MPDLRFNCLPTMIGSMPHTDADRACSLVTHYLRDIPAWPQLPKRSFLENMTAQFGQGFPGLVTGDNRIFVDRSQDWDDPLEELYTAYLDSNVNKYPVSADYAAGLYCLIARPRLHPKAVKGQITGPISWGLGVSDDAGRAVLYDEMLSDAAAKMLRLKAGWQGRELKKISKKTIIFVDEPAMSSYGSAFFSLAKEKVTSLLEEVLGGISGIKGIHCCGNTDWSLILGTTTDILSFDTYNYARSLTLYPDEVKGLLDRDGAIAWGIVPNAEDKLAGETVSSLKDRLEEAMAPFTRKGIPFRQLIEQGLLTPSCGLAAMTEEAAARALEMLVELSNKMRGRYT
ncbi:MAG: methionine synthase [Dehalococcoidales bacterium]|nr:methionine synthase [Dehalococcoidales bacterium]